MRPTRNDEIMTSSKISVAKRIKAYREEKQLTQLEFGNLLGVTPQAVSKWEKEISFPDIFLLPNLAELMNCQIDDFFHE